MLTHLISITAEGSRRVHVHRGHTILGTIDRLCPHRWRIFTADGTYTGTATDLETGIDTLAAADTAAARRLS